MTSTNNLPDAFAKSTAILLLFLAIVWFCYELIFETKVPFFRDLGPYFYPIRFSVAESFKRAELPLWDRHMAMGFPLLAGFQSASFYPPHLALLLLPFFDAVRALFVFHYFLAAFGSYALARYWGYPLCLSLIAALLFTFGGIIVSLTNVLNHFQTAVWLPLLILSGVRLVRSRSGNDFIIFTVVALLQFLAGSPEFYIMSSALLCLAVVRTAKQDVAISWRMSLLLIIVANILVAALSMVQLLPTLELFLQSRRPHSMSYQEATSWSLRPISLINFFVLDKEIDAGLFSGIRLFFIRDVPFFITLYMGQICLLGVCSWFSDDRRRDKYLVTGLVILGLLLALGRYTPVYSYLLAYAPFFGSVRFPEKFLFLVYPLLILITIQGLYAVLEGKERNHRSPLLLFGSVLILLTLVYLFCRFLPSYCVAFLQWSKLIQPSAVLEILPSLLLSLERQLLLLWSILLLVFIYSQGKLSTSLFRALIVGLVFIDLTSAHRPYQFALEPKLVTDKAKIIANPGSEMYRLFSGLPNLHPSIFRFRERSFQEVAEAVWSSLVPNVGIFYGVDYMQEIDALGRGPYDLFLQQAKSFPPEKLYPLFGALNVKYLSSFSALPEGDIDLIHHFPEYPLWLYRVRQSVPRAYIAATSEHQTNPVKTLERLASKDFDPLRRVLIDQPISLAGGRGFHADARIIRYENQAVSIDASLNMPGVLVLTDSYYPGWNAYVNGRKEKIYRANLFFRAVPLPAGRHTVEFRYEPRSFTVGLAVSLFTLLAVLATSIFVRLSSRFKKSIDANR